MTKTTQARYTLEYKQKAVRLVEAGQSQATVVNTQLIEQTLFNWVKATPQGQLNGGDSKPVSAEQMEIARLRAKLVRVKMAQNIPGKTTTYFGNGAQRGTFIQRHRQVLLITVQCGVLKVSISGYRGYISRQASTALRSHLSDVLVHIKTIHVQTKRAYGRLPIWRELRFSL